MSSSNTRIRDGRGRVEEEDGSAVELGVATRPGKMTMNWLSKVLVLSGFARVQGVQGGLSQAGGSVVQINAAKAPVSFPSVVLLMCCRRYQLYVLKECAIDNLNVLRNEDARRSVIQEVGLAALGGMNGHKLAKQMQNH